MVGEHRIIAIGTSADEGAKTEQQPVVETGVDSSLSENWDDAWVTNPEIPDQNSKQPKPYAPLIAILAALVWSVIFIVASVSSQSPEFSLARLPNLVVQWCIPVILIGVIWLLVMRHSAREGRRFGDIARSLSTESALLETRLSTVNRELNNAREFLYAQSRELDAVGRIAGERISQNADRLQNLVIENSERVATISTVSTTALENMEKLRGQLPVVTSSAKDVSNSIASAGHTAQAQLNEMISGLNRLGECGVANRQQVETLRTQVHETLAGFTDQCGQLETIASTRFAELATHSREFRAQLDTHEVQSLDSIRNRAQALSDEIDQSRRQLDHHEAESMTSLRARLAALRDESDVVSRSLRDAELRASEEMKASLATFAEEQSSTSAEISATQQTAIDAISHRLTAISAQAQQIDESIGLRADRLAAEAHERQSRQAEQERHAIARIENMLAELDGSIAERLERHRIQTDTLAERAHAVTGQLVEFEGRIESIANQARETETNLINSVSSLTQNLTSARATLAATDDDVEKLTVNSSRLLELVQTSARKTHSELPEAIAVSEDRLARLNEAITALHKKLEESAVSGDLVANEINQSGANLEALTANLVKAQIDLTARGEDHSDLLTNIHSRITEIDQATQHAAQKASDTLSHSIAQLDASLIESVAAIEGDSAQRITHVAQTLANESAAAIDKSMRTKVAEISGQLEQAVARSSGITLEASIQLRDQIAKVDELVINLESRVSDARKQAEEQVDNDFSRRAAIITESLNSNAIDIATVLSTDIADTAWANYLRGDRGIFTRRAVSLLDAGEAKDIQQVFERDDKFRANVNRYIHDFEAILRQVLSTRDGNALGVTLLSSDMGKLYVALAQGIERLRS